MTDPRFPEIGFDADSSHSVRQLLERVLELWKVELIVQDDAVTVVVLAKIFGVESTVLSRIAEKLKEIPSLREQQEQHNEIDNDDNQQAEIRRVFEEESRFKTQFLKDVLDHLVPKA